MDIGSRRHLALVVYIFGMFFTPILFAADAKTSVVLGEGTMITGLSAVSRVIISEADIQEAISNQTSLNTSVIARACIFTNHVDGDYNLTVTTDKNFSDGINFVLYSPLLKKVKVDLFVYSNENTSSIEVRSSKPVPLTDHSDPDAEGVNCANQLSFFLNISNVALRKAQAGTYNFAFTASVSSYSDKNNGVGQ